MPSEVRSCGDRRVVVASLILEYVLANAAVARSFAGYFANLIGKPTDFFAIPYRGFDLDFWAFGLVLFHMVLLCLGTSESALFNLSKPLLELSRGCCLQLLIKVVVVVVVVV